MPPSAGIAQRMMRITTYRGSQGNEAGCRVVEPLPKRSIGVGLSMSAVRNDQVSNIVHANSRSTIKDANVDAGDVVRAPRAGPASVCALVR